MERLMRLFSTGSFALCILCHIGTTDASNRIELLHQSQKILFLGDSITFGGHYVAFFDAWLLTEGRGHSPMVINVGLPSETVSGLSEDGHAGGKFPRPDLAERLDRVLALTKPDLVFACYGINCGIYQPLDDERFHRYQEGIQHLKRKVDEAGATLVLITPPFYDDQRAKTPFSYNAVLDRYADWLLAQRKDGWLIVDLHGPMAAEVAKRRETAPDFTFQPDAVHPNNEGHWFMARQLIRWFGDDEAANADSPEKMLAAQGASAEVMELVQKRMTVLRDAYVSTAGHKRPGIRPGLSIPEALKEAEELSEQIHQKRSPRHSTGKHMGHIWHIDAHKLMHSEGKWRENGIGGRRFVWLVHFYEVPAGRPGAGKPESDEQGVLIVEGKTDFELASGERGVRRTSPGPPSCWLQQSELLIRYSPAHPSQVIERRLRTISRSF